MNKVLILTADAGFGHRSAANAVAEALLNQQDTEIEVKIQNLLDDPSTPALLRNTQTDYDKLIRESPRLYEFGYESSDKPIPTQLAQIGLSAMLFKSFSNEMQDFRPDLIVNTYPLYHPPAQSWYLINEASWTSEEIAKFLPQSAISKYSFQGRHVPFITVITDLVSVHLMWMSLLPDAYCVATEQMRDQVIKNGLSPNKVFCTGIPVNSVFSSETRSKVELRKSFGWNPEKTTVLAIGSKRVTNLIEELNAINQSGFDLQLIMAAGGDENLYRMMINTEWNLPVKIYNFTRELPLMMLASDLVVTKAGGLVTSESLAAGLPIILIDILPGQEEGNAFFVEKNGAGKVMSDPVKMIETLSDWLRNDRAGLKAAAANAKIIGKPDSSKQIAKLILDRLN
jgi:1,2-diacylglycerol 3-beta-galactosyltransferase